MFSKVGPGKGCRENSAKEFISISGNVEHGAYKNNFYVRFIYSVHYRCTE